MLSAVEEIRHPGSPIAHFLQSTFPSISTLAQDFNRQVAGAVTLAPSDPVPNYPWALVGTAIDYRLRFYFDYLPVSKLSAFSSARVSFRTGQGTALDDQVSFAYGPRRVISTNMPRVAAELLDRIRDFQQCVRPARKRLPTTEEAWLCRYCAALALLDTKVLNGLRSKNSPLRLLPSGATLQDLFRLIPRDVVVDICRLSRHFVDGGGRAWFGRTVTFDPHLSGRGMLGASPDLKVDDCLLDLKTTRRLQLPRDWVDQLLVYLLVNQSSGHSISEVGLYLVRQGCCVSWRTEQFVSLASAGTITDLSAVGGHFWEAVELSRSLPPQDRWTARV